VIGWDGRLGLPLFALSVLEGTNKDLQKNSQMLDSVEMTEPIWQPNGNSMM